MAKKSKQGRGGSRGYQKGRIIEQSGGMNNAVHPTLLNENEAVKLINVDLEEKGTVKMCKGRRERFNSPFDANNPCNGITAFYPDTATSRLVFGAGTKLYKDTPHLVNSYESKADWDSGTKSSYCKTSDDGLSVEDVLEHGITDTGSLSTGSSSSDYEYGWRFTVGARDITVDKLRYYCPTGNYNRTLRLWRHSDQTKLAEVTITTEKDKWVEGEISPTVLKAGEKYTVSFGYPGENQNRYNTSNPTYGNGITFDAMVQHDTPGSYPDSTISVVRGIVDFCVTLDKTIPQDWADGEGENIAIDNSIKLTKSGEYTDTTKADFEAGDLDGVVVDDGVELYQHKGLEFDGVDDYTSLGMPSILDLSGRSDFTIECWFIPKTINDTRKAIWGVSGGSPQWGLMIESSNVARFFLYCDGSKQVLSNTVLEANKTYHIAVVGSKTEDRISMYINGSLDNYVSGNVMPSAGRVIMDVSFGLYYGGVYGDIKLRDARIWHISRTQQQIQENMNKELIGNETGLVGYWKLNEGTGSTATDSAGDNDGTVYGATWCEEYKEQGTLTKEIDISTEAEVETTKIEWTGTTPTDTSITIETALSTDGGENYGEWQTATSGSAIPDITAETDLSNARLKYRATLETEDTSVTPKLTSITISVNAEYAETGTWTGTVFDIIDIEPDTSKIEWTETAPAGTSVTVETRGGYDGVNWGDWTAQTSGEAVSTLNLYNQARVVMTSDGTATPTVSDLVLTVTAKGARAIWTSPTIDASNATDINASQALMEYTGTAEIQSRSSEDEGETWGTWVNADAEGNLNHIPNNHIQVRIIYLTTVQSLQVSFDEAPTATELATGFTAGSQFYFASLLGKLTIFNKLDAPKKWDGTNAVENLGGSPPNAQYVMTHKNYLFSAGSAENPSRLYWSDLLNLDTWNVLSFIDISPNDGDWITGLLAYGDYLIITKQRSTWALLGSSPSNFQVIRLDDSIGCIAPRSLVKIPRGFAFVSTEGIYLSDLSNPIKRTERIKVTWDNLNKRRLNLAAAAYYDNKLRVDIPSSSSTTNDIRIIFDPIRQCLYLEEFSDHAACYTKFVEAGEEILLYGHSMEGQISRADHGTTDAGEPITMTWEPKHFNFGSSLVQKKIRRTYLAVVPALSDTDIKVSYIVNKIDTGDITITIPGSDIGGETKVKLNPRDIDVRNIDMSMGYRIVQTATNGGVKFHELIQEYRTGRIKA